MEELLASHQKRLASFNVGDSTEGVIAAITDIELVLDIGAKSEGVLYKKELTPDQLKNLKVGDKLIVFIEGENESNQINVSTQKQIRQNPNFKRSTNWDKFNQLMKQKSKLKGVVSEINKGGLIVEVDGFRGFLPSSQLGYQTILIAKNNNGLVGQEVAVEIIEIDQSNNRLIFSQKGFSEKEVVEALQKIKNGQKIDAKIIAVLPFGLLLQSDNILGIVYTTEVSWDKETGVDKLFKEGDAVCAVVLNVDESLGRVNLSLKALEKDPFSELVEKYPVDEVIKATVTSISGQGITFKLEDDIEGFMPDSKLEGAKYEVGQTITVLVDEVDKAKRRINLAPLLTSTKGLIYK